MRRERMRAFRFTKWEAKSRSVTPCAPRMGQPPWLPRLYFQARRKIDTWMAWVVDARFIGAPSRTRDRGDGAGRQERARSHRQLDRESDRETVLDLPASGQL